MLKPAVPVLRVEHLERSLHYYTRVLGFERDWGNGNFASVSRGDCCIFLCAGDQGHAGSWMWIGLEDAHVDGLHKELVSKGAKIRTPPTNYPWGSCELHVEDPDGNVLRFGSDAKPGEPVGEWLDMHGQRWKATTDGGWERA